MTRHLADREYRDGDRAGVRDGEVSGPRARACWWAFRLRPQWRLRSQIAERGGGSGTRGGDRDHPAGLGGQVSERTILERRSMSMLRIDAGRSTRRCARMAKRPIRMSAAARCWDGRAGHGNERDQQHVRAGNTRTDSAHNRYQHRSAGAGEDPARRRAAGVGHCRVLPLAPGSSGAMVDRPILPKRTGWDVRTSLPAWNKGKAETTNSFLLTGQRGE